MSQPGPEESLDAAQPSAQERNKYQSPPPPPSSFTPPPSSRRGQVSYTQARTPTPTQSHLSSPPPTVRTPPPYRQRSSSDSDRPAHIGDDLATASSNELRLMLAKVQAECRSANTSAAHQRLQYELLSMEYAEAVNRFEVELNMARKEVQVLQQQASPQSHGKPGTPASSVDGHSTSLPATNLAILDLQNRIQQLETENQSLRHRLADAKAIILEREGTLSAEADRLRRRIRENREHMNRMRQSSLFGEQLQPPAQTHSTPYTPSRAPYGRHYHTPSKTHGEDEPFAALLLADQVLSQEAASTPSTPIGSNPRGRNASHIRGPHSVSSLPSTPYRSAPIDSNAHIASSAHTKRAPYQASSPFYPSPTRHQPQPQSHLNRRRDSRDSTISASSMDDREPERIQDSEADASPSRSQEVYGSQASQEAANMLRKSSSSFPRPKHHPSHNRSSPSKNDAAAPSAAQAPAAASGPVQSKMHGYHVTKPGLASSESLKRRHYEEDDPSSPRAAKKLKSGATLGPEGRAAEGVGLGIGGWSAR